MNPQNGLPDEQQALLQQLNDIVAPEPVGLWPLAPGWWLLMAFILIAVATMAVRFWLVYRANAYRRQALRELDRMPHADAAE